MSGMNKSGILLPPSCHDSMRATFLVSQMSSGSGFSAPGNRLDREGSINYRFFILWGIFTKNRGGSMNERTHAWIAIRAIALLAEEGQSTNLVTLLKNHATKASVGAWIPDCVDAKRGGGGTECHVLKMTPYAGPTTDRFIVSKNELLDRIGPHRAIMRFLQNDSTLDSWWWGTSFKGTVSKPGHHLPNRVMALSTMMKDLLLMGDQKVDQLIPGEVEFATYLDDGIRTREEAAATYFFMLSHFVADICMPCHCDGRDLSDYGSGLHKEWEQAWSKSVGVGFTKDKLTAPEVTPDSALEAAKKIDKKFGITFSGSVPQLKEGHDEWLEAMYLCRASLAVANIVAPFKDYPYGENQKKSSYATLLGGNETLRNDVDAAVMHDAVLNTATIWKHIWDRVSKE
jgi:hypothetical protein